MSLVQPLKLVQHIIGAQAGLAVGDGEYVREGLATHLVPRVIESSVRVNIRPVQPICSPDPRGGKATLTNEPIDGGRGDTQLRRDLIWR